MAASDVIQTDPIDFGVSPATFFYTYARTLRGIVEGWIPRVFCEQLNYQHAVHGPGTFDGRTRSLRIVALEWARKIRFGLGYSSDAHGTTHCVHHPVFPGLSLAGSARYPHRVDSDLHDIQFTVGHLDDATIF